jgi:single-strand DNA-binding protein
MELKSGELNNWHGIGTLVTDPVSESVEGRAVTKFKLRCRRTYEDLNGSSRVLEDLFDISAFNMGRRLLADHCRDYLRLGSHIYVEGGVRTRSWLDREGNPRLSAQVVASNVQFLDTKASRIQQVDAFA